MEIGQESTPESAHLASWRSRMPKNCPFCGHAELHQCEDWEAVSTDDLDNKCVLMENQCDKCGMAFWT